ncbi:pollen receptor-like kinase 4 [Salvia splendens]|uniref:pollen receptor-like kinase 4 n=1 Tax=Salvia splendens TaxID=180675 RepID=UPI001C266070|nr:pollen receptor-like kinase 4 [Salvia splendens]
MVHSCSAEVEEQALLKFKSSLMNSEGALWNWNPGSPACSGKWVGVLCYNNYVWGLQLERMNLKGYIDLDALAPLRFMRAMSLMGNTFEGAMPDWKKVSSIKALYLSDNYFSGDIAPDAFKGMFSLKKIHLANNNFTGPIPTSLESPKLIELDLHNNHFTGNIPLITSVNLKHINLSNNQLEGPIPFALKGMDPSSFADNKALCGPPLSNACLFPSSSKTTPISFIIISILLGILLLFLLILLLSRFNKRGDDKAIVDVEKDGQKPVKLSFVDERRQKFELQELLRASAEVLGSGNLGASYKALLVDGEAVVVKRFKHMNSIDREEFHEHMRRLGRLSHPNLLPLVAYLFRKDEKLLVFDFAKNGNLAALLHGSSSRKQSGVVRWGTRLKIIKGVTKGLMYLQNEVPTLRVAHGHLKSSNVLLDNEYNPLLMDYALHPVVNSAYVHNLLLAYKSPDYAHHHCISKKTDVWCLGILILEILTGKCLPNGTTTDIAAWINGIAGQEFSLVIHKDMEAAGSTNQMEKMLQIGISCCIEDTDKRWDLEVAAPQIDQISA